MLGDQDYNDLAFISSMSLTEWNIFEVTDQLKKYRHASFQKNMLENKELKQKVEKKLLE